MIIGINEKYSASTLKNLEDYFKKNCKEPQLGDEAYILSENSNYVFKLNDTGFKREWVKELASSGGNAQKIVNYQNHTALKTDNTQSNGTIGVVKNIGLPQESFIFLEGKWYELGNDNVKVYQTITERDNTVVIDPQIAYILDTNQIELWTGTKWVELPDITKINQILTDLSNKQNKLTPEQIANLNADLSLLAKKVDFDSLKAEVDDNFHLINRIEEQLVNDFLELETVNNLQTTNINTVMGEVGTLMTQVAQILSSPSSTNKLVEFGSALPLKTLAEAKASVEPTATNLQKFDFLNLDNNHFETKIYRTTAPHWVDLGNSQTVDLSNYPTLQALQAAVASRVLQSAYDQKIAEIEQKLTTLQNSNNGSLITTIQNGLAALKLQVDGLVATSGSDDSWFPTIDYTVGDALTPVATSAALPSLVPANDFKTIIVSTEKQQYIQLKHSYKGQEYRFWVPCADSAAPLASGSIYTKSNWLELLINPDTQKLIKILMGDQLENGTFRIAEGVLGVLEIGQHLTTFKVNSRNVLLYDNSLKTTSKDLVSAINENFDHIKNKQEQAGLTVIDKQSRPDTNKGELVSANHLTTLDTSGQIIDATQDYDVPNFKQVKNLVNSGSNDFIEWKAPVDANTPIVKKYTQGDLRYSFFTNTGKDNSEIVDFNGVGMSVNGNSKMSFLSVSDTGTRIIKEEDNQAGDFSVSKNSIRMAINTQDEFGQQSSVFSISANGLSFNDISINSNEWDKLKYLIVVHDEDLGQFQTLTALTTAHPASVNTLGDYAEITNDPDSTKNGHYLVLKNGATYEWKLVAEKPVAGGSTGVSLVDFNLLKLRADLADVKFKMNERLEKADTLAQAKAERPASENTAGLAIQVVADTDSENNGIWKIFKTGVSDTPLDYNYVQIEKEVSQPRQLVKTTGTTNTLTASFSGSNNLGNGDFINNRIVVDLVITTGGAKKSITIPVWERDTAFERSYSNGQKKATITLTSTGFTATVEAGDVISNIRVIKEPITR